MVHVLSNLFAYVTCGTAKYTERAEYQKQQMLIPCSWAQTLIAFESKFKFQIAFLNSRHIAFFFFYNQRFLLR